MTFGEMQALTDRFNQILGAGIDVVGRLKQLANDLVDYAQHDYFAAVMWFTVQEELDDRI